MTERSSGAHLSRSLFSLCLLATIPPFCYLFSYLQCGYTITPDYTQNKTSSILLLLLSTFILGVIGCNSAIMKVFQFYAVYIMTTLRTTREQ